MCYPKYDYFCAKQLKLAKNESPKTPHRLA